MTTVIAVTTEELGEALTEWDRRWREEPDRFASEAEHLAGSAEEYGAVAGPYLVSIVEELHPEHVGTTGSLARTRSTLEERAAVLAPGPTSREILEEQARRDREVDRAFPLVGETGPDLLEGPTEVTPAPEPGS